MTTPLLRQLAHKAMAQTPSPWHRHQPQARHLFQDGLAFNAVNPPGPSFNYVAVLGITKTLDEVVEFYNKGGLPNKNLDERMKKPLSGGRRNG